VGSDLKVKVTTTDKKSAQLVEAEVSQFITHLKDRPFESQYKDAIITISDRDPEKGFKVDISSANTMGTSYRIKNGEIHQIGHSYGRVRFVVNHTTYSKTAEGRLIPTSFSILYYSNETDQLISQIDYKDTYTPVENVWLPVRRTKTETAKNVTSTLELEFTNQRLLK
jgi:hypothetical protein